MILNWNQKRDLIEILVNKILIFFILFLLFGGCSSKSKSKLWGKDETKIENPKIIKKILNKEIRDEKEFNPSIKIIVSKGKYNKNFSNNRNNTGELNYDGYLKKLGKYKFAKFNDFEMVDVQPLFYEDKVLFFDNKGKILFFNENQKIIWKENFYNKSEKKLRPRLNFANKENKLVISDDVGKYYSINLETGKIIWTKNNIVPFNSDIKIYKDFFFVVDSKNILRCISIKDGLELWNFKTEISLTKSNTKLSIILDKKNVYFNNSIGDITAVDLKSGELVWQLPTQKNNITENAFLLSNSNLVANYNTILFSNNKNEFYSIDTDTGSINWKNEINSTIKPIVIDKFILTVSKNGYMYLIEKKSGNILRINDLYKDYNDKKRSLISPTGFVVGKGKVYLTNDDGNLIVADLNTGTVLDIIKIARSKILQPLINKNNLYLIKNGSIIKFN